jgi:hypothetical protein
MTPFEKNERRIAPFRRMPTLAALKSKESLNDQSQKQD